jgi:phage-related holin
MIKKFLDYVVYNFGFESYTDFSDSMIHNKLLFLTIPFAGASAFLEYMVGLQSFTLIAFVVLVILELVTGLVASKNRGEEIVSRKFSRFGFKVFVWFLLIYIVNSMKLEYRNSDTDFGSLAYGLFIWLHGTLFIYIVIEYLISVLENLGSITGNKKDNLIKSIIRRLNDFIRK